jgi:hypothetical protein
MRSLSLFLEMRGGVLDQKWLDTRKPVITKDGRNAIIEKIDYSSVPNKLIGKVSVNDNLFDFEWDDSGICLKASDKMGNACKPTENDNLVKAY